MTRVISHPNLDNSGRILQLGGAAWRDVLRQVIGYALSAASARLDDEHRAPRGAQSFVDPQASGRDPTRTRVTVSPPAAPPAPAPR